MLKPSRPTVQSLLGPIEGASTFLRLGSLGLGALAAAVTLSGCGGSNEELSDIVIPAMTVPAGSSVEILPTERLSVRAFSTAADTPTESFVASNLIDGNPNTVWLSDASTVGFSADRKTITIRLTEPLEIEAIRFTGLQEPGTFGASARIKTVRLRTDSDNQLISLHDTPDEQEIEYPFGATSKLELEVTEVYSSAGGSKPIGLAEISLLAGMP